MRTAKTNGFRWLPSYYEAVRVLPDAERLALYDAICDYGFGNAVEALPPLLQGYFSLIRPTLERSIRFEEKQIANGKKGGRPPKPRQNPNETQKDFAENLDVDIAVESDVDIAVESDVEKGADKPPRAPRFAPPSVREVAEYCQERGNAVDAQRFIDYYTANGWRVGQNPMRDWKAAVRNWEQRERGAADERFGGPNGRKGPVRVFKIKYDNEID